ncbi:MAG: hypothetical protein SVC26_07105 [Pseudomonadota bacterium]|nr:hypothetical protein [Pseudomonadota bacterium]
MKQLKELWQSFAPGVRALITMVALYLVLIGVVNASLEQAMFWSLLITAFFFPAIISGIVEIVKMAWSKISASFKKQ